MALYDGFFDARYDEDTDTYDRAYDVEDFTTYFGQIVGSGVCVYRNADSYKVRLEDGGAVINPGYLFINGHWLKNDADYTVELTGSGIQAVVAHLNASTKRIELEARSAAQSYPDSLVLALVDVSSGTVEDTRYNEDICGVIEPAGGLSERLDFCLRYIDDQIQPKLDKAEADINAQAAKLDRAIESVAAEVDKITPPPIGSIKFSVAQDVGDEWLKCDGHYITEGEYPDLVALLRKDTIPPNIQNITPSGLWEGGLPQKNLGMYLGYFWCFINSPVVEPSPYALVGLGLSGDRINIGLSTYGGPILVETDEGILPFIISFSPLYESTSVANQCKLNGLKVDFISYKPFTPQDPPESLVLKTSWNIESSEFISILGNYLYDIGGNQYFVYGRSSAVAKNGKLYGTLGSLYTCEPNSWVYGTASKTYRSAKSFLITFSMDLNGDKDSFELKCIPLYTHSLSTAINNANLREEIDKNTLYSRFKREKEEMIFFSSKDYKLGIYLFSGDSEQLVAANSAWITPVSNIFGGAHGGRPLEDWGNNEILTEISSLAGQGVVFSLSKLSYKKFAFPVDRPSNSSESSELLYLENWDLWVQISTKQVLFAKSLYEDSQFAVLDIGDLWKYDSFQNFFYLDYDGVDTLYFGFINTNYKLLRFSMKLSHPFNPLEGANLPDITIHYIPAYIKAKKSEGEP